MKNKKLNVIDVIIITAIILLAVAIGLRALSTRNIASSLKDKDIIYTVEIYNLDNEFINAIQAGEKLYLSDKSIYCGEIINVSTTYAKKDVQHQNGDVKSHIYPKLINMSVSIKMNADLTDSGFYIGNNTYMTNGTTVKMNTDKFSFTGKIVNILTDNT